MTNARGVVLLPVLRRRRPLPRCGRRLAVHHLPAQLQRHPHRPSGPSHPTPRSTTRRRQPISCPVAVAVSVVRACTSASHHQMSSKESRGLQISIVSNIIHESLSEAECHRTFRRTIATITPPSSPSPRPRPWHQQRRVSGTLTHPATSL